MFTTTIGRKTQVKRMLVIALVCVTAFALTTVLAAAGSVEQADASTLQGKAYSGGTSNGVSGAGVYLYRYNGSSWTSLGRKAVTNSSGRYSMTIPGRRYYYVAATKSFGSGCYPYGHTIVIGGNSASVWLPANSTRSASLRMYRTYEC